MVPDTTAARAACSLASFSRPSASCQSALQRASCYRPIPCMKQLSSAPCPSRWIKPRGLAICWYRSVPGCHSSRHVPPTAHGTKPTLPAASSSNSWPANMRPGPTPHTFLHKTASSSTNLPCWQHRTEPMAPAKVGMEDGGRGHAHFVNVCMHGLLGNHPLLSASEAQHQLTCQSTLKTFGQSITTGGRNELTEEGAPLSTIARSQRVPDLLAAPQSANTASASHVALSTQDEHVAVSCVRLQPTVCVHAVGLEGLQPQQTSSCAVLHRDITASIPCGAKSCCRNARACRF